MSGEGDTSLGELSLCFDGILVGMVVDAFVSDETGHGTFRASACEDPRLARARDFVRFCVDWNARTRESPIPPDAAEFDAYGDVVKTGRWHLAGTGLRIAIEDAPVFFPGDDVSWRPVEP